MTVIVKITKIIIVLVVFSIIQIFLDLKVGLDILPMRRNCIILFLLLTVIFLTRAGGEMPVSYTHLDVYKRQAISPSLNC